MKILFTGGGTMGSVSPLIAIHQQLTKNNQQKTKDYQVLWLGTRTGPERKIVEKEGIEFKAIAAGKLRRYFDLRNIIDLAKIKIGFWQAFFIILKFKPDIILSAGSFVSVPVVWAGWVLRIPSIIHQQDVRPGLANRLMAPFAARITVALDVSLEDYSKNKTVLAGNPVRQSLVTSDQSLVMGSEKFEFKNNLPILLVMGGGTGALKINELIWESLDELTKFCNVLHLTGKNKNKNYSLLITHYSLRYKSFEFLTDKMADAYQAADLVVSRAGMSALTELAYLKKPAIVIPIPNSHQEDNAKYFAQKDACLYLDQRKTSSDQLVKIVRELLRDGNRRRELGENMHKIFIDYSGKHIIKEVLRYSA